MDFRARITLLAARLRRTPARTAVLAKALMLRTALVARSLRNALSPASLSSTAKETSARSLRAAKAVPGLFRKPPLTIEVRLGWCTRTGWNAPGTCVFFDIVNRSSQSMTVVALGVGAVGGKDVTIAAELFHPTLPYEIGGRQRRVFSIPAFDLVSEMGTQWARLDLDAAFVACSGDTACRRRLTGTVRERLREEYYGSA